MQIQEERSPEALLTCPVCEDREWDEVAPKDRSFQLWCCRRCGCCRISTNRLPPAELYESYYTSDSARRLSGAFHHLWQGFRRLKARRILHGSPAGSRVCDIGCERGELLQILKQAGWQVVGTQVSRSAAAFARTHFGIEVFVGEVGEAPFVHKPFDVVLMIHVLEHLPCPQGYLASIRQMLRPGGLLWVEVPNSGSFTARICGKRWLHHDPEHHFWNFQKASLRRLLHRYGFTIESMAHVSWEHGPIGCMQSWLNFLPGPRNLVFEVVREGWSRDLRRRAAQILHVALGGCLLPAACVVSLLESACGNGQIVLVKARTSQ